MSTTPRTEAMLLKTGRGIQVVSAAFARQLETEIQARDELITSLKEAITIFRTTAEHYQRQKG